MLVSARCVSRARLCASTPALRNRPACPASPAALQRSRCICMALPLVSVCSVGLLLPLRSLKDYSAPLKVLGVGVDLRRLRGVGCAGGEDGKKEEVDEAALKVRQLVACVSRRQTADHSRDGCSVAAETCSLCLTAEPALTAQAPSPQRTRSVQHSLSAHGSSLLPLHHQQPR